MNKKSKQSSGESNARKNQKANLKPIPSTIRGKKRYVLFELHSDSRLRANDVNDALWAVLLKLFGEKGVAGQKLWLVLWDEKTGKGIARCSNNKVEELKEGILFMKEVRGAKVVPRTISTSGSMLKLKELANEKNR
jgi:ribonuclease P/MRP protein subunit POP5